MIRIRRKKSLSRHPDFAYSYIQYYKQVYNYQRKILSSDITLKIEINCLPSKNVGI